MELYIVRHGKTEWNKDKRLQGSTDIPLNESGRELARISGETLKDTHFDRIYSSPLSRAYETACLFRGTRTLDIITDERLRELNFGDYEGKTMPELNADPSCTFRYFFDQPERYTPAENGETLAHLCERAADFMEHEILPLQNQCERVMIVAHGAINKALMSYVKKHDLSQFWSGGLQRNCNVIILRLENNAFTIIDETRIFYPPRHSSSKIQQ
jgi:probable phosphoglycerate mutase